MSENKIGSDILGQGGLPQGGPLGEKKRAELLKKMKEQKRRKAMGETTELNGKEIPKEAIPGDQPPEPKPGEGWTVDGEKPVKVRQHRRGKPKPYFERKADEMNRKTAERR